MKLTKLAVASLATFSIASGGSALAQQPGMPGMAGMMGAQTKPDPAAFARGAKAWAGNCAQCHNMRDPKEFRDDQWKVIMSHMRIRSGLTGQEARDILRFLEASN